MVPGKPLSSDRLLLDLDDSRLVISGPADMSGVPFEGSWTQPLAPDSGSRVAGEITLSEPVAKALGLKLALLGSLAPGAAEPDRQRAAPEPQGIFESEPCVRALGRSREAQRFLPRSFFS